MAEESKRLIQDAISAINSHDVEKLASLFTEDCFYEDVALGGVMHGSEAVKTGYASFFTHIPDFHIELKSLFIADTWGCCEWVMTGTSTSGKSFSTRGATINELQGARIKRNSDYYDPSSILQATQ
jgi:steroid delta-isomerase-like uncharacterized protein